MKFVNIEVQSILQLQQFTIKIVCICLIHPVLVYKLRSIKDNNVINKILVQQICIEKSSDSVG